MNLSKNKNYLFLILGLILILLIPLESLINQKTNLQVVFNKKLNVKEQVVSAQLENLIQSTNVDSLFAEIIRDKTLEGLSFYAFQNGQLKYWSKFCYFV
jgi:hypothetical protein